MYLIRVSVVTAIYFVKDPRKIVLNTVMVLSRYGYEAGTTRTSYSTKKIVFS